MAKKKELKILALIPARSGSKGIPGKNVRDIKGHPLMAYSIGVAQLSRFINRIVVTTDSEDYAKVARDYGAETPFIRPAKFAKDTSGDLDYHTHAINWLEKNEKYRPDLIVILRPTAPARDFRILDKVIELALKNKKASSVRTAHLADRTAYKMFRIKKGHAHFFGAEDYGENEESMNMSRQFVPKTYEINGYIDVAKPEILKKSGMIYGKKVVPFIISKTADIDDLSDWNFAETLLDKTLVEFLDKKKSGN